MTQNDFFKLTSSQKEKFLSDGGILSSGSTVPVLRGIEVEPLKKPVESEVIGMASTQQAPLSSKRAIECKDGSTRQYDDYKVNYDEIKPNVYAFKDPVELLFFLDDDLKKGKAESGYDLHPWQIQIMMDFAAGINGQKPTQDDPFQAIVRACNGSGKDRIVIASCAVWLCMCTTLQASAVITSSSGVQLDNQTCSGIENLCHLCNKKIHPRCWKVNYRYYECLDTRSPIMCFATDEPGKAEGYHPITFNAAFALFESEAKTVPDEIYVAQNKCTGYTHRCIVSTPGLPVGHFYDLDTEAIPRSEFNNPNVKKNAIDYVKYHIRASDCPHLSTNYVEQMKRDLPGGEEGGAFQSQVMAEFGTTTEEVVIPYAYIWRLLNSVKKNVIVWRQEPFNTGGLDLSRGGDELVLTVRNGNRILAQIPFSFPDTETSVAYIVDLFREWKLNSPEALVFVDCGGLGAPIYDRLKGLGWTNCRYVVNQGSARDKRQYKNRGAEMWWNLCKLIERQEIILIDEPKLRKQLAGRHYKKVQGSQHQLLDKKKEKADYGYSPDRADACVLCFSNYKPSDYEEPKEDKLPFKPSTKQRVVGDLTLKGYINQVKPNAGLPTTRINEADFDDLKAEFNMNKNRQQLQNN